MNDIIFASMKKDCVELGCQFDSELETNTSLLGFKKKFRLVSNLIKSQKRSMMKD